MSVEGPSTFKNVEEGKKQEVDESGYYLILIIVETARQYSFTKKK